MKGKGLVFVLAVSLILTITSVCLLPSNLLAGYSFWYGTDLTQTTMPNPLYDSSQPIGPNNQKDIITRPGLQQPQAQALISALQGSMPDMFSMLLFNNNPKGDQLTTIRSPKKPGTAILS